MSVDPFLRYCIAPFDSHGFIEVQGHTYEDFSSVATRPIWDAWATDRKLEDGLYFSWEETWLPKLGGMERTGVEFGCVYLIKDGVARRLQPGDLEPLPPPRITTWPPK